MLSELMPVMVLVWHRTRSWCAEIHDARGTRVGTSRFQLFVSRPSGNAIPDSFRMQHK
jgi:hypothetical protein